MHVLKTAAHFPAMYIEARRPPRGGTLYHSESMHDFHQKRVAILGYTPAPD
jgi:hypothetical protein